VEGRIGAGTPSKRAEAAGHVDDAASRRFAQQRQHGLRNRQSAKKVRSQYALDGVEVGRQGRTIGGIVDAGVVDQNVQTAEVARDVFGGRGDRRKFSDVDRDEAHIEAFGSKFRGSFFAEGFVACSEQDGAPRRGQLTRNLKADSFVRSRDQRDFFRFALHTSISRCVSSETIV
jgi:hypothetical protein